MTLMNKLTSILLIVGCFSSPVFASSPELSDRTFRTVNKVQKWIAEEKYDTAINKLNDAIASTSSKKYDQAVLLQQMGFLHSLKEDYKQASHFFAQALKVGALPVPVAQQVRYSLAQLYLAEEQYQKSVNTMVEWFKVAETTEDKPNAHAYITLASAYVQMEDYKRAIPPTQKAIAMSKQPSESWYLLLLASHYELKQFKSVAGVLKTLTNKYPANKRYWMQLSSTYMELNQNRNALGALESAYDLGLLETEKEYLRLVNFMAYQGIPYRAAKTLKLEMEQGNIASTQAHIEKLGSFYHQAKELDESIQAYQNAYQMNPTVKSQLRIARLMLQDKQYTETARFATKPAPDASRDEAAELHYIKGMAHFELEQDTLALNSMRQASQSVQLSSIVNPWIVFLQN
ncbi:tetratricopeptide repeat protein [Vibrio astriarenae]